MEKEGADFETVLKEAQEKGYAERNPEADVEGHDACRKIAILSSLMMGMNVDSEKIFTEGITKVTAADFVYAKAAGKTIKLLARSKALGDDKVLAMVAPFMLDKDQPLSMVNDVFNAVLVTGNMLGDSMYYGRGAGKLPTASAVVSDVVDCARHQGKVIMCFWEQKDAEIADVSEVENRYFVRGNAASKEKILAAFEGSEVLTVPGRSEDFAIFTVPMKEKEFAAKCEALGNAVESCIRLY
jgi:homoserine dehydrogenase